MAILCIETGGDNCSVALSQGKEIVALKEYPEREHAKYLSVFIDELMKSTGLEYAELDAVAVGKGPGSYTGLRIGVATAKGICYGVSKPLIAVDSLLALAATGKRTDSEAIYCPMIDARRMEVYTALFDASLQRLSETKAMTVSESSFDEILEKQTVCFFGSGAAKCRSIITRPNAVFIDVTASATGLAAPANEAFLNRHFENVAYFEPLYLKDFVATTSKKNLLTGKK
jgi:tRNA threonylcarbamoyladenosine biosynthesis protein TsaB